jgi:predicted enzyme related to lactoylglutathione lyase
MDWAHPLIGGVELKAANLNAQKDFYTRVFGMKIENKTGRTIHLTRARGEAWLRIQPGGTTTSLTVGVGNPKPAFFFPIWISYETKDIKQADAWLQQQKVTIIRPLTSHEDWDGTDVIITDIDGNAIQVVQYGTLNGE